MLLDLAKTKARESSHRLPLVPEQRREDIVGALNVAGFSHVSMSIEGFCNPCLALALGGQPRPR